MIKQKTVYNFFKFLKEKRGEKMPFDIKLKYFPQEMTKEDLKQKDNYLKYMFIVEPYSLTREELNIEGDLDLTGLAVRELPDNINVNGNLTLRDSFIEELPNNLTVTGNLDMGFTDIEILPDDIKLGKGLICDNSGIKYLPDNLTLDVLDISFTIINEIPNNFRVKSVHAFHSSLKRKYSTEEEFKNAVQEKGGYVEKVQM